MVLLISAVAPLRAQERDLSPLVIEHVTTVDVRDGHLDSNQTIVIVGHRISAIGVTGSLARPSGATVVNASGQYMIPGLWDMHVHAWNDPLGRTNALAPYLANGLTGVRLMWGDRLPVAVADFPTRATVSGWQREIAAGTLLGPRIVAASNVFDGPKPVWPGTLAIHTPEEGRQAVREAKRAGADFIKVYNGLLRDAYYAVLDEAVKQRLPVAGHVPDAVTAAEASDAGQASIEHLDGVLTDCSSNPAELRRLRREAATTTDTTTASRDGRRRKRLELLLAPYDERACAALLDRFVRNHTWQVPTLTLIRTYGLFGDSAFADDPRLRYVSPPLLTFWSAGLAAARRQGDPEHFALQRRLFVKAAAIVGAMQRAGVPILAGTDEGDPYVFAGFSLHDELALLVQAGLTPLEALRTATLNPAVFLKATDSLGTIEPGKLADLVLLEGDPLANIRNTARVRAVVANGRYLDRRALDALLATAEATGSAR
jgi:imidazolonepropionase-like amidohydrolase